MSLWRNSTVPLLKINYETTAFILMLRNIYLSLTLIQLNFCFICSTSNHNVNHNQINLLP